MQYAATLLTSASLRIMVGTVVFAAFWVGAGALTFLIRRIETRLGARRRRRQIFALLAQTSTTAMLVLGGITALGTMGVNVSALVAGLGLTGFALGFALKDAISNLLAGILILLYEPFTIDDHIAVTGIEGRVVSIDPRYTILAHEQRRLLIPNAMLFTNTVTVWEQGQPSMQFAGTESERG